MSAFGFLLHGERPLAAELGAGLAAWLEDRGHEVRFTRADAKRLDRDDGGFADDELGVGLDLMVGIGGDGTMLDAVGLAAPYEVPVLGVNVGQLGYLTTIEPAAARSSLKRFLAGAFIIEERMRISGRIERVGGATEETPPALNEVLLERSELGHTVRIDVTLDGEAFTPYVADGVILATPTGSTAYAFSARGPIVDPRHRAQVLVPVSPHMLFDRALVLAPDTAVRLSVAGARPAHLSLDGHSGGTLEVGDAIVCSAAPVPARLVRFGPPAFHRVLKNKFGLADR
ncbi:MAG: NAD(+)/NADH kinase [Acidimicrobiales bacterium]